MNHRIFRLVALLAIFVLTAAACGDKSKVGDESLLNFKDQVNQDLGATTTTLATTTTTVAGGKAGVGQTSTTSTTAKKTATTQTTVDKSFIITINGDKSGAASQFDPSQASVYVGQVIKWVNKDSVPRSVVARDGLFRSPDIPPGGEFLYQANKAGEFPYQDGTRPYANGYLRVVAK